MKYHELTPERLNGICQALDCQPRELLEYVYWKRVNTRLLPRQKSLYINTLSDFRGKAATRF